MNRYRVRESFTYSPDGHGSTRLIRGMVAEVRDELVPGLAAAGHIDSQPLSDTDVSAEKQRPSPAEENKQIMPPENKVRRGRPPKAKAG